jgi:hypothetical protein
MLINSADGLGIDHLCALTSVDAALGLRIVIVEENAHKGYDTGKEEPRGSTTIGSRHVVHLHVPVIPV